MLTAFLARPVAKLFGVGLIALLIAGLWLRGSHYQDQRDAARELAKAERVSHLATQSAYRTAQAQAHARAIAEKQATEARYSALQEKADETLAEAVAHAQRAVSRLAAGSVRGQAATAAGGDRGKPDLPDSANATARADGPDQAAVVVVSRADLDILAENTARLIVAKAWAEGLAE